MSVINMDLQLNSRAERNVTALDGQSACTTKGERVVKRNGEELIYAS